MNLTIIKEQIGIVTMPFGKYKGETVDDVAHIDLAYLEWLAAKDNGFINICLQIYLGV